MKSLFRSRPVTIILGFLIWMWMALVARTVRWTVEGEDEIRDVWNAHSGAVIAAWHSRIMLLPAGWILHMRRLDGKISNGAMLISLSPDGEAVARAIDYLGLKSIRGSAANKKKVRKDKGGVRAVAEAVRLLRSGTAVCITPDGPRGPAETVTPGAVMIAQRAGAPIVPYALSIRHGKRLNTWDRFIIPFPFSRGAIVYGPRLETPRDADPETLRAELQKRLDEATRRADMLAGCSTDEKPVSLAQ